jgi:aspartyl-tRNA(Asn)/glutamyl-tRNA(Gln) amidotransferase subunit A
MSHFSSSPLTGLAGSFKEHSATHLAKHFHSNKSDMVPYLNKIFEYTEAHNPHLNAVTSLQKEYALAQAAQLEQEGPRPEQILYGVPVLLKENVQKKGFPVQCGSNILKSYTGQFDATFIERLEAAGAILIGTTNMDEFAMGSSNEFSAHGPVKNPHDLTRVSGGSSGGSAAACAAGFAPLAFGSDTGGSVREPAAFCGIFGFKPTYGRVSRYGLVAFGSSLDQISPFARTAQDLDTVMTVIGHNDPRDATSLPGSYTSQINKFELKGKKIGIPRFLLEKGVDSSVLKSFHQLENNLIKLGATVIDIPEIKGLEHTMSVYYIIATAEASSNLARFDGIRYGHRTSHAEDLTDLYCKSRSEGFGKEVKLRIMLGTFALSAGYWDAFYNKAQAVRRLIQHEFAQWFQKVDFIYLPTAPSSAFGLGEHSKDPLKMYLNDIFTIPANLARLPALSLPTLVPQGELPIGLQFIAPQGHDSALIALAHFLENAGCVSTTPLVTNPLTTPSLTPIPM